VPTHGSSSNAASHQGAPNVQQPTATSAVHSHMGAPTNTAASSVIAQSAEIAQSGSPLEAP
jgi:hypothetical protein